MSRHRDFKGNNFDYSDDDTHSNSVTDDENYGSSPNTAALYMYDEKKSGNSRDISNFLNYRPSLNITEECFPDQDDDVFSSKESIEQNTIGNNEIISFREIVIENPVEKKEKKISNLPKVDSLPKVVNLPKVDSLNKIQNLPKVDSASKLANVNKNKDSPFIDKISDKNANIMPERSLLPYDPTMILEIYKQQRPHESTKPLINVITIGHVDAGKSTLMGNLLYQINYVSERKLAKYKHEAQKVGKTSFSYAWILDESEEERTRGITTDVAQTYFETQNRKIGLLDAPGHRDFIPSMITGAAQADAALLIVNATKGEFETGFDLGGQTREHTCLVRMLGISELIVAVNKMDTVNWSQERFNEICDKMKTFLKTMRITGKFLPVSGLFGTNITDNIDPSYLPKNVMQWFKGPTLIEFIDQLECPIRSLEKPLRISVTDIFKPQGSGVYQVAGKIVSGGLSTSHSNLCRVLCMPSCIQTAVKSIKMSSNVFDESGTCSEMVVSHAFDGDQVVMNLVGIDLSLSLEVGSIICNPDYPITCTNRIRAKILIFELKNSGVITRGYNAIFYYQSINVPVQFKKLHSTQVREGKKEVEKLKPRFLTESSIAEVDLHFDKPICIETYQNFKSLGKFTIRESGNTIAGGTVLKLLKSKQ